MVRLAARPGAASPVLAAKAVIPAAAAAAVVAIVLAATVLVNGFSGGAGAEVPGAQGPPGPLRRPAAARCTLPPGLPRKC